MRTKIQYPSKGFQKKALTIIQEVLKDKQAYDYYHIFDKLTDDTPELQQLINSQIPFTKFKISAGTSDYLAYRPYLKQIISDIQKNSYYRSYNCPLGNVEARNSIARMENSKFTDQDVYSFRDIALTEGSTGAISQIFEYIKRTDATSEVIITAPTYYLYKYLAQYFQLKYQEAFKIQTVDNSTASFNGILDVYDKIGNNTKLIIIVQPNNPSSQLYPYQEIEKLLLICKKKNILLLVDELFYELIFDQSLFQPTDLIAKKTDTLNNLAIIKGYSKSKNLAGFRIGYVFSKNKRLLEAMEQISEQRQCFSGSSNNAGLIALDSFVQTVTNEKNKNVSTKQALFNTKQQFDQFSPTIKNSKINRLEKIFLGYLNYIKKTNKYYSYNYNVAISTLNKNIEFSTPKISAFNTFVKIKGMDRTNYFDFCLNLYLCTNIVSQIGPCFAFDQRRWQTDPCLGFWLRLSYSRDRNQFVAALQQFNDFRRMYLENPNKFIATKLCF